jgi:hypothetical protein
MNNSPIIPSALLLAVILLAAILLIAPTVQARSVMPVDSAKFDTVSSMKDNLKACMGKDVVIHLRSGKTFQGNVKAIGDHLIHLEKLAGRDFYDALIRMEDISAVETKFREMK